MLGGTCGAEIAPIAWLNSKYDGNLAVVWLDAHGDLNTPASSPSGHFHGMALRMLMGEGDAELLRLVPLPLRPEQVTLAGTRDLDPPESEYVARTGLVALGPEALANTGVVVTAVGRSSAANLYIHLDLDFLDPNDFPAVLVPTEGGITLDALAPIIGALSSSFNVVGASVVEFAPGDSAAAGRIASFIERSGLRPNLEQTDRSPSP